MCDIPNQLRNPNKYQLFFHRTGCNGKYDRVRAVLTALHGRYVPRLEELTLGQPFRGSCIGYTYNL